MPATSANIDGYIPPVVKGIAQRDRPLGSGYCGNDNCEHVSHKSRRSKPKKEGK